MSTTGTTGTTATPAIRLSTLLHRPVLDTKGHQVGTLADAIVRLDEGNYPRLTGLVVAVGSNRVFAPLEKISDMDADSVRLRTATLDLRPFTRREGEVLLKEDVLGHRLIDTDHTVMVKAFDIELNGTATGWTATGLDVHKPRWFTISRRHDTHPFRDWNRFLPLIGHEASSKTRSLSARFAQLKPAQIADLIEDSSDKEQDELLARVHSDPELEADVFEELDEDRQSRILRDRTDAEVADVLSHMRADDAADAVMDLPQERRTGILTLLPAAQHTKVMALLGYHDATAGGLMGTDYTALPATSTIADALESIRTATTEQPEALTTIYSLHPDGTLAGVIGLVQALQSDPAALLGDTADPEPVSATAGDDIIDVTTTMADYNLLTLPVLDEDGRILGVITVDDALEAAIPPDWAHREPNRNTTRNSRPGSDD
ncbi:CBS domain-containing protein (plasmid) [Arthrobacter sp. FW306-05-C]|uniref:magnesium transporter MgtE N-terminal domain-containing protein n=1 Tax=Micrococcaceae TaxID=1268 RepID=UPI001EEF8AE6|nr:MULTISPECIES: CBS domain-containing protein [unclassified Arthrobacter]UKA69029.1 CBS domain-containing protein [Arthrobacter sp. FW306-05-C]UKA73339.1 CBS domain-containing protein [Arthrobacter sp. FW306-06-A]